MQRRHFLAATGAAVVAAGIPGRATETPMHTPTVTLSSGKVRGRIVDGVHRFLGIPYAEPPFGEHRFVAPVPRSRWDGVLDAGEYGAICPQTGGAPGGGNEPDEGEDCLNLNVWTPDPGAKGLPVMVWVHGGGQVAGSGAAAYYDGTHFAKSGVVLITNNRRLGAEGYLYLAERFGEGIGPGNLGILDQIEVLRWVQENVERFGGDPGNVTLFGESGGGAATQAVVATTGSKGLLHRVIPQSGGHAAQRPDSASAIADLALRTLGLEGESLDALRSVPWQRLVEIYGILDATEFGRPQTYLPVISEAMPVHPADAGHAGAGSDLDCLIGTCLDEARLFSAFGGDPADTPFHRRARRLLAAGNAGWDAVAAAYGAARPELDAAGVELAIMGDMWFRAPSIRIADGHAGHDRGRTYMYLFTWESERLGATHAMDIAVFGNGLPFGPLAGDRSPDRVAEKMRASWVNFARSGDPSIPGFDWPEYDAEQRLTASLNDEFSLLREPYRRQRAALGEVLTMNWGERGA